MARSRRAKSQSVSSASGIAESSSTPNGIMPPPPSAHAATTIASTPKTTRHRKTPSTSVQSTPRDRIRDTPLTVARTPIENSTSPVVVQVVSPQRPSVTQYLVVVGLSSLVEAFLQSIASQFGTGDLAAVSKHSESWIEIVGLLGWKFSTLAVYWFGGFDAYDVAALTLVLRAPTILLLRFFYLLQTSTLALTTISSVISTTLPFILFRSVSPTHKPKLHSHAPRALLRNRAIITDPQVTITTALLSAAIFTVTLEIAFQTYLPVHLVTTFAGLKSLEFIHLGAQGVPVLLVLLLPVGYAITEYIFAPSTGATDAVTQRYTFDPATAGFIAHVYHNTYGWYSARQRTLISRTFILGVLVMTETIIECAVGLKNVDLLGAVGYAGVWGAAVAVTGIVLDWVGGPSD